MRASAIVEDNGRLALRVRLDDEATLIRAAVLEHSVMTDFILRHALEPDRKVIEPAEHLVLAGRNSLRVLEALENPPAPNAKLLAAVRCLPQSASRCRIGAKRRSRRRTTANPSIVARLN